MDEWRALELLTKKRVLTRLVFVLCVLVQPLFGQTEDLRGAPPPFEKRISDLWARYLEAKTNKDVEGRERIFGEILQQGQSASADVFELGSFLFVSEGMRDLERGDLTAARDEFHNAVKLNPYSWPAYEGLGLVKKAEGDGMSRYLSLSMKGMRSALSLKNAWFMLDVFYWVLQTFSRALMLLMVLFAVVMCGKYVRQAYASTLNAFEERHINAFYARLLALGTLCLPPLAGFNIYLCAGLYLVLFLPFFDPRERLAGLLVLTTPLLLPVLGFLTENVSLARVDPPLKAHLSQFGHGDISARLNALSRFPGKGDNAHLTELITGLLHKTEGDLRGALAAFEKIPGSSTWHDHAVINIGNIRFLAKEYQEASEQYRRINQKSAVYPLARYNLGMVKSKQAFHDEAEQLRAQAVAADPNLDDRGLREGAGNVLDALPNYRERLLHAVLATEAYDQAALTRLVGPALGLVLGCMLLALLHLRSRNARLLAKACDKCGRIFFPSDSPESDWCSQCVTLYIKKDDLPSEAKLRKHDEVTRYSKRRRRLLTVIQALLPGTKKMLTGNAVNGVVTLFLWILLLLFCIVPMNAVQHLSMRFVEGPLPLTWITIGITLVYWLIFGLRPILQED